jgi:hypothetical protein
MLEKALEGSKDIGWITVMLSIIGVPLPICTSLIQVWELQA